MIDEIEGVISDIEAGVANNTPACVNTLRRVQKHIAATDPGTETIEEIRSAPLTLLAEFVLPVEHVIYRQEDDLVITFNNLPCNVIKTRVLGAFAKGKEIQ